ncbi:MAG: restriction endonuclease subunit S [Burkholderiaceae bacterium]|nr:restriction endonuclease subunit S [Burkholderiaceae bacterium]
MTAQPLGEIAEIIRGISFPKDAKSLVPRDGDVACLRTTNVQREVEWDDLWFVPTEHVKRTEQFVQSGDILISTANSFELVGKVALVAGLPRQATLGAFISLIRPRPGVDPKYLYHQLAWGRTQSRIRETASTTTNISNVSSKKLAALELDLPPVDEQRRIVAELDKQFSRLDETVANLKRVKVSISRYQASALSEAARSGERWANCTIADLLRERIVNGLSVKESTSPTSVRALRLSAMCASGLDYADHRFLPVDPASVGDILVEEGDFFVSRGNGSLALVGRGAVAQAPPYPVIFPDTMMRLRFADAEIRRWVATLWPSRLVRRQIEQRVKTTAGIYKIAQPQVASISLPLPPASERDRIVAEVDRRLSIVREVEAAVDANLKRAQALRQAVLARAFTFRHASETMTAA